MVIPWSWKLSLQLFWSLHDRYFPKQLNKISFFDSFSPKVLRSTFSSIIQKRIFTLSFDRSCTADNRLLARLNFAAKKRALFVTTPTALKSVMLKFVEMLCAADITDSSRSISTLRKDTEALQSMLIQFQKAHLIMDEVDLILHPLRSELNFPIGDKLDLDFNPLRWRLPIHLFDAVFYAETEKISGDLREAEDNFVILKKFREVVLAGYRKKCLQKNPHIVLLDLDFYHKQMRPLLMEWAIIWLNTHHFSGLSTTQVTFLF